MPAMCLPIARSFSGMNVMNSTPPREFVGVVTELDISGWGPNSAQLEFSLTPQSGQPVTFVMEFDAMPQMFADNGLRKENADPRNLSGKSNWNPSYQRPKASGLNVCRTDYGPA